MGKLFKVLGLGFLIIMTLGVMALLSNPEEPEKALEPAIEQPVAEAEKEAEEEAAAPEEEPADMDSLPTKAEYDAIKDGMTREQVEQLLGKVEIDFESESEFDGIVSLSVTYRADGEPGANIFVTYMNGEVDSKSHYGLNVQ